MTPAAGKMRNPVLGIPRGAFVRVVSSRCGRFCQTDRRLAWPRLTLPDFAKRIRPGRHQDHFAVRRADGRYRINYRADFRPESFADVLKRWLAKDGKLITKQLAEAA